MGHYVYKFVDNETSEIIYIGKNDTQLSKRVQDHMREKEFQGYSNLSIYYIEVDSGYMSEAFETMLINKYKPCLNVSKLNSNMVVDFVEPAWKEYKTITNDIILKITRGDILKEARLTRIKYSNIIFYRQLYQQMRYILNKSSADEKHTSKIMVQLTDSELKYMTLPYLAIRRMSKSNSVKPKLMKYDMSIVEKVKNSDTLEKNYIITCRPNQDILGIALADVVEYASIYGDMPLINAPIKTSSMSELEKQRDIIRYQFDQNIKKQDYTLDFSRSWCYNISNRTDVL